MRSRGNKKPPVGETGGGNCAGDCVRPGAANFMRLPPCVLLSFHLLRIFRRRRRHDLRPLTTRLHQQISAAFLDGHTFRAVVWVEASAASGGMRGSEIFGHPLHDYHFRRRTGPFAPLARPRSTTALICFFGIHCFHCFQFMLLVCVLPTALLRARTFSRASHQRKGRPTGPWQSGAVSRACILRLPGSRGGPRVSMSV